jgi:hypothetical protein
LDSLTRRGEDLKPARDLDGDYMQFSAAQKEVEDKIAVIQDMLQRRNLEEFKQFDT